MLPGGPHRVEDMDFINIKLIDLYTEPKKQAFRRAITGMLISDTNNTFTKHKFLPVMQYINFPEIGE